MTPWTHATILREVLVAGLMSATAAFAIAPQTEQQAEPDPQLRVARSAVLSGRVEEALTLLAALAAEQPESTQIALWHGHAFRRSGDPGAAAREYLRALRLQPTNAGALVALGDMQSDAGNLEEALAYYERASEAAPALPAGYRKAAGAAVQLAFHGDAIRHLHGYVGLRPTDVVAMTQLGVEQYLDGDIDGAVATLERVLELDPDLGQAHFGLGMALADLPEKHERAIRHLERAVKADPDNAMALYLIGRVHGTLGNLDAALEALDRSLALDPGQADAHYRLALVHARLGDRETAGVHQARFQELSRARVDLEERARRIEQLKDTAAALATSDLDAVRQAARQLAVEVSDDPDVLIMVAQVELGSGDLSAALAATDRTLALRPDHFEALYLRGILLHRTGSHDAALEALEAIRNINPLYAPTHAAIGNVLLALSETAAAVPAYQAAIELDPENPAHFLNLATAYGRLGHTGLEADALQQYQRLLGQQSQ